MHSALRESVRRRMPAMPLPAAGQTILRWRVLAEVGAQDLPLAKLFEGHADALAIMMELDGRDAPAGSLWGTWCAEPPSARPSMQALPGSNRVRLRGRKAWCSGAALLSHALVSAWNEQGEPCLAAVDLRQPEDRQLQQHQPHGAPGPSGLAAAGRSAPGSVDHHPAGAVPGCRLVWIR
jgi:hypothetical protein